MGCDVKLLDVVLLHVFELVVKSNDVVLGIIEIFLEVSNFYFI